MELLRGTIALHPFQLLFLLKAKLDKSYGF